MATQTDELKQYEIMLIFSGEISEADFEKQLDETRKFLKENTHKVLHEEIWGRKEFSYRVKRQSRGYYVLFDFEADSKALLEVRAHAKFNQSILRYLITALPADYEFGKYHDLRAQEPPRPVKVKEKAALAPLSVSAEAIKPTVAGKKEEEELESVSKKLEKILENPDIEIK